MNSFTLLSVNLGLHFEEKPNRVCICKVSESLFLGLFIHLILSSQYGSCTSIIFLVPGSYNPHLCLLQGFQAHLMTTSRNLFQSAGLKRERHIARPLISFIMLFFMSRLSTQRLSASVTSSISSRHFSTRL